MLCLCVMYDVVCVLYFVCSFVLTDLFSSTYFRGYALVTHLYAHFIECLFVRIELLSVLTYVVVYTLMIGCYTLLMRVVVLTAV